MPDRPSLAKSELEVAQIVWELGSATVRDVLEAMPRGRDLDFKTVQTYLRRLEAKGYLAAQQEGRAKVYRAKVRPKTVVRELVEDFVQRVFQGDPLPLVQNIIQEQNISREDIDRLREMLDQMEDA
jgi:predicted transcriptional regulator